MLNSIAFAAAAPIFLFRFSAAWTRLEETISRTLHLIYQQTRPCLQFGLLEMGSSTTERRAGLSKNARPPPLLKNIPSRGSTQPAVTSKKRSRAPEKEVDISAPPLSSDDESSGGDEPNAVVEAQKGVSSSSSSGDESPDRAEIRPTAFPSSLQSAASISSSRSKVKYGSSQGSSKPYGSARGSQESKPSSSQRGRNAKEPSDDELGPVKGGSLLREPGKTFTKGKGPKPSSPRAPRQKRMKKTAKGKEFRLIYCAGLVLWPCTNWNAV